MFKIQVAFFAAFFVAVSGDKTGRVEKEGEEKTLSFELPENVASQVAVKIEERNLSIVVQLEQNPKTKGTVFVFYRGGASQLELISDSHEREINVYFRLASGEMKTVSAVKDLADGKVHRLIFEISKEKYRLLLDCKQLISGVDFPVVKFGVEDVAQVFVGHRKDKTSAFNGRVIEFTADSGKVEDNFCTPLEGSDDEQGASAITSTTTVGATTNEHIHLAEEDEEAHPVVRLMKKTVDYLSFRVAYLERVFKELRNNVHNYREKLNRVQLHQRECRHGPLVFDDGDRWKDETNCTDCVCHQGDTICHKMGCPKLACRHPFLEPESCCPKCLEDCLYEGESYEYGTVFYPHNCVRCHCGKGGTSRCAYVKGKSCTELKVYQRDCPSTKMRTPERQCCQQCHRLDFCQLEPCHQHAVCKNEDFDRLCLCKQGFFGDGINCFDIDECAEEVCGTGTRCINTPGSFRCECLPGFLPLADGVNCYDNLIKEKKTSTGH